MNSQTFLTQFPHLLSVKQVADVLGCTPKAVYNKKAKIPGYIAISGMIRFDGEVLLKYIKEHSKGKGAFGF